MHPPEQVWQGDITTDSRLATDAELVALCHFPSVTPTDIQYLMGIITLPDLLPLLHWTGYQL